MYHEINSKVFLTYLELFHHRKSTNLPRWQPQNGSVAILKNDLSYGIMPLPRCLPILACFENGSVYPYIYLSIDLYLPIAIYIHIHMYIYIVIVYILLYNYIYIYILYIICKYIYIHIPYHIHYTYTWPISQGPPSKAVPPLGCEGKPPSADAGGTNLGNEGEAQASDEHETRARMHIIVHLSRYTECL